LTLPVLVAEFVEALTVGLLVVLSPPPPPQAAINAASSIELVAATKYCHEYSRDLFAMAPA
jgi:hypothetical protein